MIQRSNTSGGNAGRLLGLVREVGDTASSLWWRFFDWLAQVPWRKLFVIWFLLLLLGATPFGMHKQAVAFIIMSFGLKVLAGGKRKAEIEAQQASRTPARKAWSGAWSKRRWRRCRRRSSRTFYSTRWR